MASMKETQLERDVQLAHPQEQENSNGLVAISSHNSLLPAEVTDARISASAHTHTQSPEEFGSRQVSLSAPAGALSPTDSKSKKKPPRKATAESPNVCYECKTTDSKLWRRGPDGHLMCNACGLRWRRSNKAKDAPKSTPRKRKMPSTSSLSPQSPQPMSLPQSSMMAAQRGGLLPGPFATGAAIYGAMPPSAQNFGQLQYQPQNMYLHQQQQLAAQQAQYRHHANQHQANSQRQHLRRSDPQIDPALMSDENGSHGGMDIGLHQGMPQSSAMMTLPTGVPLKMGVMHHGANMGHAGGSTNGVMQESSPSLAHIAQLHEQQLTQNARQPHMPQQLHSHLQLSQNSHRPQGVQTLAEQKSNKNTQSPAPASNVPTQDQNSSGEQAQSEDFSGLLSLKAYVDDTGRHY